MNRRNISVGPHNVHYLDEGQGAPLLLVHGFLVNHKEWQSVLNFLTPHFRCIAPDLIGCGESSKPSPDAFSYSRHSMASTLREFLDRLGVSRVHLCGHSMGGGVALWFASEYPEYVHKLTLIDSIAYPFPLSLKGRLPLLPVLGPVLMKYLYRRFMFRLYFETDVFTGSFRPNLKRLDEYYRDFSTLEGRTAAHAMLHQMMDLETLASRVSSLRAPTHILWGELDRIFPLELGERLARELPKGTLQVVPRCGHAPNEERPELIAEALLKHHTGSDS